MTNAFVVSQFLLSLYLIAFIWFVLFRRHFRDRARYEVQAARNNLFDFMWKNGHSFDNKDYQFADKKLQKWENDLRTLTIIRWIVEFYFNFHRGRQKEWVEFIEKIPKERPDDAVAETSRKAILLGLKAITGLLFVYGIRFLFTAIGVGCIYVLAWVLYYRKVAALKRAGQYVEPVPESLTHGLGAQVGGLLGVLVRAFALLRSARALQLSH